MDLHQCGHLASLKFAVDELVIEIDLESTRRQQTALNVVTNKKDGDRVHPLALLEALDEAWRLDA